MTDAQRIRQARELIALPAFHQVRDLLDRGLDLVSAELAPAIVFKSLSPTHWIIGVDGQEREYWVDLVGLSAAWIAIHGGPFRAVDLAKPGSTRPANIVRDAITRAREWLETRCPPLARELRRMRVVEGRVLYEPTGRQIVTL